MNKLNTYNNDQISDSKSEIWIVEDFILFRDCLSEVINLTTDLKCTNKFGSCEEALNFLSTNPAPKIILLDIGLPGISGLEGIQKIKECDSSIQIIIITIHEDCETVYQAICAGAVGYLLKTTSEEKMIESIRDVLNGGSPINPQIARKVLSTFASLNQPVVASYLSSQEREVLRLMIDGLTKKAISSKLNLSFHTIDTYIRNIYTKLQVNNRSSAIVKAIKNQIL